MLISNEVFERFIETGNIGMEYLIDIAVKIMMHQELTDNEKSVFSAKTAEINDIVVIISKIQ
jgi:hypothetical protein